jgi:hypothetical protein
MPLRKSNTDSFGFGFGGFEATDFFFNTFNSLASNEVNYDEKVQ